MPQLQNLVLTDRAATPVNHTFTPEGIKGDVASVVESTGVPVGANRFTISLTRNGNGKYKANLRLAMPVVQTQTINGVSSPVVVRAAYADLTFTFDPTSTTQERKDIVGMLADSLGTSKTLVNDAVVNLQAVY